MKIKTKLGIITLLVPLATLGCQNAELVTEDISSSIIMEEEQPELEIEFEFETETVVESTVKTSSEIETTTETETEPIPEEEYKIEVLEDKYNVNEFAVHSDGFIPSEELMAKFNNIIDNRIKDFSFYVISLDQKLSFGFNPDQRQSCASSIKAPFSLFCYKQLENGEGSLDEIKSYDSSFYCGGSGIMQYSDKVDYTIRELLYNTIHYSDNIAYGMVFDRFGAEGYNEMLDTLGCTELKLTPYCEWGHTTSKEMAIVWQEIYRYKDTEYGKIFFDDLINAEYNFIKNTLSNYTIAHKSGYNDGNYNDHGIVFDDEVPYIISIMIPNPNGIDNHPYLMSQIASLSNELIGEYKLYLEKNKDVQKTKTLV